jgi:predicted nucleic acid-binding protein
VLLWSPFSARRTQATYSSGCARRSAEIAVYLDSSALVKLIVREDESEVLAAHLTQHRERVSCALARVEVPHAVHAHGAPALTRARGLLERIGLLALDDTLLDAAGALAGSTLRSLDAIHLAAAQALGTELAEVITYDHRMAQAAVGLGLAVSAPTPVTVSEPPAAEPSVAPEPPVA